MFVDTKTNLQKLFQAYNFVIFVAPKLKWPQSSTALIVSPNEKNTINVDQIRDLHPILQQKQSDDFFIFFHYADRITESAENALLKILEEPQAKIHLIFLAEQITTFLPTVLSRAQIFFLRQPFNLNSIATNDPQIIALAKQLISSQGANLVQLADTLTKGKERAKTLEQLLPALDTAIEILEKSYFTSRKPNLLFKLSQCLHLADSLEKNGHIKLHLVADLC